MKKIIHWSAASFFSFAILAFLLWPNVLANYAWYSAQTNANNPAVSIIPQADIIIANENNYEYTTLGTIKIPHIFENTVIEYHSSNSVTFIDADSNARFIALADEPMLNYFLRQKNILGADTDTICEKLRKIDNINPCTDELSFLQVLLHTSPETVGFFAQREVKLYGAILLAIKSIYITPDTTDISSYTSNFTKGFMQYTPNGILANVFYDKNYGYNIASYNMTPEETETMVAAIKNTKY